MMPKESGCTICISLGAGSRVAINKTLDRVVLRVRAFAESMCDVTSNRRSGYFDVAKSLKLALGSESSFGISYIRWAVGIIVELGRIVV